MSMVDVCGSLSGRLANEWLSHLSYIYLGSCHQVAVAAGLVCSLLLTFLLALHSLMCQAVILCSLSQVEVPVQSLATMEGQRQQWDSQTSGIGDVESYSVFSHPGLTPCKTVWLELIKIRKIFSILMVTTLLKILQSTFRGEIGLQFARMVLSLPFFGISEIWLMNIMQCWKAQLQLSSRS